MSAPTPTGAPTAAPPAWGGSRKLARRAGLAASGAVVAYAVASVLGLAPTPLAGDGLSSVLLAYLGLVTFAGFVAAPRAELDAVVVAFGLAGLAAQSLALMARDVRVFALGWCAAPFALYAALSRSHAREHDAPSRAALRRLVLRNAVASAVPMALCALVAGAGHAALDPRALTASPLGWGPSREGALCALALLAVLVRTGAPPFHAWIPAATTSAAPLAVSLPLLVSPLGAYAFARVVLGLFPGAAAAIAPALVALGLGGAVYGALVALGRDDLQRVVGFVLASQQGFVLAGLAERNAQSVSGGVAHALAAGAGAAGLLLLARGLTARTGSADMRVVHGAGEGAPHMAAAFLLLVLAEAGFPGTAAFVSEDLLVRGLVREHPALAAALLGVTATQGIVLYRAWTRAFAGPASEAARGIDDLLARERLAWLAVMGALVAGGFAAGPLLAVERGVATALHERAPSPH